MICARGTLMLIAGLVLSPAASLGAPAAGKAPAAAKAPRATPAGTVKAHDSVLPFLSDDFAKAVAEARARKVPIFVEAWAPW